jgi:hypothetical protein
MATYVFVAHFKMIFADRKNQNNKNFNINL